jgi:predicted RNase H-like HicB family nuclease
MTSIASEMTLRNGRRLCPAENSRMRYKVVLERSEEGVAASVPGLPGCWSQGETEAEALENIRIAIIEYLETVSDLIKGR